MSSITEKWRSLRDHIDLVAKQCCRSPHEINVVAASKYANVDQIKEANNAGCRSFGENRLQDALLKQEQITHQDIDWHFIGSLQTKKVPKAVGLFSLIHSVDSVELAQKIASVSQAKNIKSSILLQVNVSQEPTKHGFTPQDLKKSFEQLLTLHSLQICGLMTMAPLKSSYDQARRYFAQLRQLKDTLQQHAGSQTLLKHLSMGMSQDWQAAVAEGATLLRVGSSLFLMDCMD